MFEQTREPRLRFLYLDIDVHMPIIECESLAGAGANFGRITTQANDPRQAQFGLKVISAIQTVRMPSFEFREFPAP